MTDAEPTPTSAAALPGTRASAVPERSLRANIAWTVFGNAAYLASQWGLLLVLAKFTSPADVGLFGLALAVAAPVFAFAMLQLRAVIAADVVGRFEVETYLSVRLAMTAIGFAVVAGIGGAVYGGRAAVVVGLVGAMKAVENLSEVCYGVFQRDERMDIIARSMVLKGTLTLAAAIAAAMLAASIVAVTASALGVWALTFVVYDLRHLADRVPVRAFLRFDRALAEPLLRMTLPLGAVTALIALSVSAPRYAVESVAGVAVLGFYTAVSYIPNAVGSVVSSVGQASSARLARLVREPSGFAPLLWRLSLVAVLAGVLGAVGTAVLGRWALGILYTPEYGAYAPLLIGLFVAFMPNYLSAILVCGLFAVDELRVQLPVVAAMAVAALGLSVLAIPRFGLWGAVLALGIANAVQCAGYLWALRRGLRTVFR